MAVNLRGRFKKALSLLATATLLAGLVQGLTLATPVLPASSANAATNPTCTSTMTAQSQFTVSPSHGQVFYIDSGVTPKNDAAYAAYRLTSASTSARTVWVSLENFSGGKVNLANPADQYQQITVPASGSATVFFLLKATGSSLTAQSHTVKIYDKRPDLIGASSLLTCDFSFVKVAETIKASSNKIDGGITGALSPATAVLGGTYTVTISSGSGSNTTQTGKVGSGSAPDYLAFWASPAAFSNWPTRALRLESTSITIENSNGTSCLTVANQLLINQAMDTSNCFGNNSANWHATYTFRIIGPGPSALAPQPVAIISSGTQYKHSPYVAAANNTTVDLSGVVSANGNATISLDSRVVSSTASQTTVEYTATIRTNASSSVRIDEMVATNQSGMTYVTGSSRQGVAAASMTAASDPTYMAADASLTPPPYHYVGPFSVDYRTNYLITYRFTVPCTATQTTYSANVVAYIGDVMIGSGQNSIAAANIQTQTSGSTCSVQISNTTTTMAPTVITSPADNISSSAATIYGQFNANNNSSVDYRWIYSTDPNLVNSVTASSWTSITGGAVQSKSVRLTSLSQLTTYYFQAQIRKNAGTATIGETLSFTTSATQYSPTVDTRAATRVSASTATLNGMVNPNLTAVTGVYFSLCSDQALTSSCSTITVRTDNGSGSAIALTFAANSAGDFPISSDDPVTNAQTVTGLTSGNTYYFRASVTCTDATYCAAGKIFGPTLKFTAGSPSAITDNPAAIADTAATLNGTFNANGAAATANTQFCYGTSPLATNGVLNSCTSISGDTRSVTGSSDVSTSVRVTSLTSGATYYYQAIARSTSSGAVGYGAILSFTTLQITTPSLPSGSIGTAYQASLAGLGGSTSYDWSTDSRLPGGLTLGSNGLLSGTPTEAGTFSITMKMIDLASGQYTTTTYTLAISATVTFHSNFTGGAADTTQSAATATALTANGFTRAGYGFAGWATSPSGTKAYDNQASYPFTADGDLYAVWTPVNYTAGYNLNGGTGTPTSSPQAYNSVFTLPVTGDVARTGYNFAGWLYNSVTYSGGASFTMPGNDVTFMARWTANSYSTTVSTDQASSLTFKSAVLNGTVTAGADGLGNSSVTSLYLCYSTTNAVDANGKLSNASTCSTRVDLWGATTLTANASKSVNVSVGGLTPGSTYQSQIQIGFANGVFLYGSVVPFTILNRPNATTNTAQKVSSKGATIRGAINPNKNRLSKVAFCWGTDPTLSSCTHDDNTSSQSWWADATTNSDQTVSADLSGLTPHTTYYYQVYTIADDGGLTTMKFVKRAVSGATAQGTIQSFTTAWAETTTVTPITQSTATLKGTFHAGSTDIAHGDVAAVYLCYSTASTLDGTTGRLSVSPVCSGNIWGSLDAIGANTSLDYSLIVTGLQPGTQYYSQIQVDFTGTGPATANGGAVPFTTWATVTFDSNYPAGTNVTTTQSSSGSTYLTANTWSYTGYTFKGWTTTRSSSSVVYADQATYSFSANLDLYAVWQANQYTVSYALNSGSWVGSAHTEPNHIVGDTFTLPLTSDVRRTGYTFGGWTSGGVTYSGGATFTMPAANVTLTASWIADVYTVTYDSNTATGTADRTSDTYTVGTSADITLPGVGTMAKVVGSDTYTFGGWSRTAGTNGAGGSVISGSFRPDSSLTLYAVWIAPGSHTVTFHSNVPSADTTTNQTASGTSTALAANTFSRSGYTFQGWTVNSNGSGTSYSDGASFNFSAGDADLYAVWQAVSYTVTYDANGGSGTPTEANHTIGQTFTTAASTSVSRDGYTFAGWSDGTTTYQGGVTYTMPAANTTLTALWTNIDYTVTYFGNGSTGGSVPVDVNTYHIGASVTVSGNVGSLVKTGYSFAGWNTEANGSGTSYSATNTITVATESIRLYAQWTINSYTVTFSASTGSWSGSAVGSSSKTYQQSFSLPLATTVTKTGYTFAGWTYGGSSYAANSSFTMPATNVNFVASYTAVSYSVRYENGGGTWTVVQPTEPNHIIGDGFNLAAANTVARTGYTFLGWSDGSASYSADYRYTVGSQDLVFTAQWSPNTYTVTYNPNTASGSPSRSSDTFTVGTTSPLTLPTVNTMTLVVGSDTYTFNGWSESAGSGGSGGSKIVGTYSPSHDVTLFAIWVAPNSHVVTFNSNYPSGSNSTGTQSASSATNLAANTFSVTGYTFAHWNTLADGTGTSYADQFSYSFASDLQLYAIWTPDVYTVHWDGTANGGSANPADSNYTYGGSALTAPTPSARTGYTFLGWYSACTGGTLVVAAGATNYRPGSSLTLCGVWQLNTSYTVTFHANFGSDSTTTQNGNSTGNLTANPFTQSGYSFAGWATAADGSGTQYADQANYGFGGNLVLYAKWTANSTPAPEIPSYIVIFDYQGGSGPLGAVTGREGASMISLPSGTRTGFQLLGWSLTPGGSLVGLPFVITQNQTLYAVWRDLAKTHTVSFNYQGGSGTVMSVTYTEGEPGISLPAANRSGYNFLGWAVCPGTTPVPAAAFSPTSNVELCALWAPIQVIYVLSFDYTGGEGTLKAMSVKAGDKVAALPGGTRSHYSFVGWSESQLASTAVELPFQPKSSLTMFAMWVGMVYTVLLHQGSNLGDQTLPYQYGTPGLNLPALTAGTGSFDGWSTDATGTNKVSSPYVTDRDVELYGQWTVPTLISRVLFKGDSFYLSPTIKRTLKQVAAQILASPLQGKLLALGWVKRTADTSYDQRLSADRANAVVKYLRSLGVDTEVYTQAKGIAAENNANARRVDIYVTWSK